ncbi:hypothetical protein BBP40_010800 [Aspergillus hancockii]|nr:hypothetical protein BBP40_010800 [Aspergillus hancockii]
MPRRKEPIYCIHCVRHHPRYYGAALKTHIEAHRRALQRRAQPEPEPQPRAQHQPSPGHGASITSLSQRSNQLPRSRVLDVGNLNNRNIASVFTDLFDLDNNTDAFLLNRILNASLSPYQEAIENQGPPSLLTSARNKLRRIIDPLIQEQVMVPQGGGPFNPDNVQWPQPMPSDLPVHLSLTNTSIGKSLLRDDAAAIKMLVTLGVDPNSMLRCEYRILAVAVLAAAENVVEYLLSLEEISTDERANAYGEIEETAMLLAFQASQLQIYGEILAANNSIIPGRTMFGICAYGPLTMLNSVLALNADVRLSIRAMHPTNRSTPLHGAVLNEDPNVLARVLELGRRTITYDNFGQFINPINTDAQTPLLLAVENRRQAATKALLGLEGIEINARASGGQTALWYAARNMDADLCQTLKNAGADAGNPREGWIASRGTPFNALAEAYLEAQEVFTQNPDRIEAETIFENARRSIERIGWLLTSLGTDPNVPDLRTYRVPLTMDFPDFPVWQDFFI